MSALTRGLRRDRETRSGPAPSISRVRCADPKARGARKRRYRTIVQRESSSVGALVDGFEVRTESLSSVGGTPYVIVEAREVHSRARL